MIGGRKKLSSGIGGRTGKKILLNKNVRKLDDGRDNFEDYFTESSDESETTIASRSPASRSSVSRRNFKLVDNRNIQDITYSSPVKNQSKLRVIGSRSNANILPPKNIRKLDNGMDNFEDYFTDNVSYEKTSGSSVLRNSEPSRASQVSSKSKNTTEVASAIAHSSPVSRSSSSKVIGDDDDNPSGSESGHSDEEMCPFISNISIARSKTSAKRSTHEKQDSCDAKLLKLAEDFEKSENGNGNNSQISATEGDESNEPEALSQRIELESPVKETASNVNSETHYLTRSKSPIRTPFKLQSENSDKTTDKTISLKRHKQNTSQTFISNTLGSEQSRFDTDIAQSDDVHPNVSAKSIVPFDMNTVPEQGVPLGTKSSMSELHRKKMKLSLTPNTTRKSDLTPNTRSKLLKSNLTPNTTRKSDLTPYTASKLPIKRKSNLTPNVASKLPLERKLKLTPQTASKQKNMSFVDSSMHNENVQASKDLLGDDLNIATPEEHPFLTTSEIETSIETPPGNVGMTARKSDKNIPKDKQARQENTSDSNELHRRKSVRNHSDVNIAQDSEDSSEEKSGAQKENVSYRKKDVASKSNPAHITTGKKKASSFVTSAKKHKPADEPKERMSSSSKLSAKSLEEATLNVQPEDGSPNHVLNTTYEVNDPVLSNNEEISEERDCSEVSAGGHENREDEEKAEQTGKRKKAKKSRKNSSNAEENEVPAPCRRSARKRMAPLETWRNERPLYRIENGSIHFVDIDPGNKEDDGAKKSLAAKLLYQIKRKKELTKEPKKPSKVRFKDLILEKKVSLSLVKKFNSIPWQGQSNGVNSYSVKRVLQTPNSNFGFIEIPAGSSKPMQYLPSEDMYICLIQGKLKVSIGESEVQMEVRDIVVIPRSVPYTLNNNGQRKALLVFSVGRFKYLEHSMHS